MQGAKKLISPEEFKNRVNDQVRNFRPAGAAGPSPYVLLVPVGDPSVRFILLGEPCDKDVVQKAYDEVSERFECNVPARLVFWPE